MLASCDKCCLDVFSLSHTLIVVGGDLVIHNAKQKHPGCKKVRGQSEAALQICRYVRSKTLISVEAKKLLIKNLFHYLNDIQ